MTNDVRVRFAPSPTGSPHVGNIRSALFNWLFARHSGGTFILRVEDTDQKRESATGLQDIMDSLRWLGLNWDEGPDVGGPYGPYIQSQRLDLYHRYAQQLLETGHAYRCYCPPERLEALRQEQLRRKDSHVGYDRRCRFLSPAERAELEAAGAPAVVRLAVPLTGQTRFHDLIHGEIVMDNALIDDQVLIKADGFPTYHLANVVDDHLMRISHILRADEWLSSVPKHVIMYQALGWEPPLYCHLPRVLGPDRKKLSKRHGSTSVLEFRAMGYLPEALFNFLALVGWSYDGQIEIMSRDELIQAFTLDKISAGAGVFDHQKLDWMNGVYIRALDPADLGERLAPFLARDLGLPESELRRRYDLTAIAGLVRERIERLTQATEKVAFLFAGELDYDPALLIPKKMDAPTTLAVLRRARSVVLQRGLADQEALEADLRALADELGIKVGLVFGILRVAITGQTVTPPLLPSMAILGLDTCRTRLDVAERRLAALIARTD